MFFRILSLISLISVTCHGAVDLEALKLKAAAYAQEATPATATLIEVSSINQEEKICTGTILCERMTHITTIDTETNYHYDKSILQEYAETRQSSGKEQVSFLLMDDSLKTKFRSALLTNNSDNVAQVIKEFCFSSTVDTDENHTSPSDSYWTSLSPLQIALASGQYDIAIELIINKKADINFIAKNGATALACVIYTGHHHFLPDLLRFMVEQGANLKVAAVVKEETDSALSMAALVKNFKAMQILEEEYNIYDPLLPPAQKAEWNNRSVDVGVIMHQKNGSIASFETLETMLVGKFTVEKVEILWALPTKKISSHQDSPLLQAVNDQDINLVAYILNRCGTYIANQDAFFAAIRALQTGQSDTLTLFKDHGLIINDVFSGAVITCDFDENNPGPYLFKA